MDEGILILSDAAATPSPADREPRSTVADRERAASALGSSGYRAICLDHREVEATLADARWLRRRRNRLPVIAVVDTAEVARASELFACGVQEIVVRDASTDASLRARVDELFRRREPAPPLQAASSIVARSPSMRACLDLVRKAQASDATVLLLGETGTGKESNEEAIALVLKAIEESGYKPGKDVFLALDVAASEFFNKGFYQFEGRKVAYHDMIKYYDKIIALYPVLSIEDGLSENDWEGWKALTDALGGKVQLVGDDLFVTNTAILAKGIKKGIANSILIKLNQIGTMTETLDAIEMARNAGYTAVISHRSGETEDTTIADLSIACNTGFIKTGSLARSERVAKYNRLLQIEEELSGAAQYRGRKGFYNLSS